MAYKLRPLTFVYYRLLFAILLFTVGIFCLGQPVMEYTLGYSMIPTGTELPYDAMLSASIVSGILSLAFGSIILRIMVDKRVINGERRQRQVHIDFPDRRSGIDRRTG